MTTPPGIVVRRATRADVPALGRLGGALVRQHHGFDPQRFMSPAIATEDGYGWFLGTQLDEPDALVLVAEREGEVVGYVYAAAEERSWEQLREPCGVVHDLEVADGLRGLGIGRALLAHAAEWFRARGLPRMLLWTAAQNHGARRLFERLGFRATMIEMTCEL